MGDTATLLHNTEATMRRILRFVLPFVGLTTLVAQAAAAQAYAPAVDRASLLNMRYYAQSGGFMVDDLQVVFPPADASAGELTVTNGAGETVASIPLDLRAWPDWPAFGELAARGPGIVHLNAPGDYTMTVRLGDDVIGTLAYTVTAAGGGDPFNPQKTYVREGPWRSLAYLAAPAERPDEALVFNFWTSLREIGAERQTRMALRLTQGGTEAAVSRSDVVASSPNWQGFSQPLVKPDKKSAFTLADLTGRNGAYRLTVLADGKPVKSYALTVAGGQVQAHPRSALPTAPSADFLTPRRINTSSGSGSRYVMEHVFWMETTE